MCVPHAATSIHLSQTFQRVICQAGGEVRAGVADELLGAV
ncbi:MAG: hypothetical protein OJF49_003545 [Ktedonobacterales bacterium]|nr:MAG: hypothetical protein OJF49_003545 [Ktedonobacterales bacterium]